MTLPCKHAYHACCGSRWLSINKVSYWTYLINQTMIYKSYCKSDYNIFDRLVQFVTQKFLLTQQSANQSAK